MPIFGLMTAKEVKAAIADAIKNYPEFIRRTGVSERYELGDSTSESATTKYYKTVSWVNTAFSYTSVMAATTPLMVKEAADGEQWSDVSNHPFEKLLRKPNARDSRTEFLRDTFIWRKWGNCFWWLNKYAPDRPPSEIWILPANRVTIIPDEQQFIKAYSYDPGYGRPILIPPDEIIHFKGDFNPDSVFVGLGELASLFLALDTNQGMNAWNAKLFKTGNGVLPGVLAFNDWVQDEQWKPILETIDKDARNRRIMALRGTGSGVEYIKIGGTQEEMEFMAGLIQNRDEIWAKIAPGLSSILSVNATEANAKAGRATLLDYKIFPDHVAVAEKITSGIMPYYGDNLKAEFEDVRYTDRALQLQETESFSKVATVGEVRTQKHNLPLLGDERDTLLVVEINKQAAPSLSINNTTSQSAEKPPAADNAMSDETDAGQATSESKAAVNPAEKALEIKEFRKFARNRKQQGRGDLISAFEFKFVPEGEQAALVAEYTADTHPVKSDILILAEAVNGYAERVTAKGSAK